MNPTGQLTRIFCTHCGTPADAGARFCNRCGRTLGLPERPVPQSVSSEQWPYSFLRFDGEKVQEEIAPVTVEWLRFEFAEDRYERPTLPRPFPAKILLTNQRIVLLDRQNTPLAGEIVLRHLPTIRVDQAGNRRKVYERHAFPLGGGNVPLSPFWAFQRAANEGLYTSS